VIKSQETVSIDEMTRKFSGIADSAAGLITQVQGELTGISGQAQTLLANLNEATGPTNRKQIAEILQQVNALVTRQGPKLDQITDQVLLVSRNADSVVRKIGPVVDHTDATIANVNLNDKSTARPDPAGPCAVTIRDGGGQDVDCVYSDSGAVERRQRPRDRRESPRGNGEPGPTDRSG